MTNLQGKTYTIHHILEERIGQIGRMEWLVKWLGYKHSENSWEPLENLENGQQNAHLLELRRILAGEIDPLPVWYVNHLERRAGKNPALRRQGGGASSSKSSASTMRGRQAAPSNRAVQPPAQAEKSQAQGERRSRRNASGTSSASSSRDRGAHPPAPPQRSASGPSRAVALPTDQSGPSSSSFTRSGIRQTGRGAGVVVDDGEVPSTSSAQPHLTQPRRDPSVRYSDGSPSGIPRKGASTRPGGVHHGDPENASASSVAPRSAESTSTRRRQRPRRDTPEMAPIIQEVIRLGRMRSPGDEDRVDSSSDEDEVGVSEDEPSYDDDDDDDEESDRDDATLPALMGSDEEDGEEARVEAAVDGREGGMDQLTSSLGTGAASMVCGQRGSQGSRGGASMRGRASLGGARGLSREVSNPPVESMEEDATGPPNPATSLFQHSSSIADAPSTTGLVVPPRVDPSEVAPNGESSIQPSRVRPKPRHGCAYSDRGSRGGQGRGGHTSSSRGTGGSEDKYEDKDEGKDEEEDEDMDEQEDEDMDEEKDEAPSSSTFLMRPMEIMVTPVRSSMIGCAPSTSAAYRPPRDEDIDEADEDDDIIQGINQALSDHDYCGSSSPSPVPSDRQDPADSASEEDPAAAIDESLFNRGGPSTSGLNQGVILPAMNAPEFPPFDWEDHLMKEGGQPAPPECFWKRSTSQFSNPFEGQEGNVLVAPDYEDSITGNSLRDATVCIVEQVHGPWVEVHPLDGERCQTKWYMWDDAVLRPFRAFDQDDPKIKAPAVRNSSQSYKKSVDRHLLKYGRVPDSSFANRLEFTARPTKDNFERLPGHKVEAYPPQNGDGFFWPATVISVNWARKEVCVGFDGSTLEQAVPDFCVFPCGFASSIGWKCRLCSTELKNMQGESRRGSSRSHWRKQPVEPTGTPADVPSTSHVIPEAKTANTVTLGSRKKRGRPFKKVPMMEEEPITSDQKRSRKEGENGEASMEDSGKEKRKRPSDEPSTSADRAEDVQRPTKRRAISPTVRSSGNEERETIKIHSVKFTEQKELRLQDRRELDVFTTSDYRNHVVYFNRSCNYGPNLQEACVRNLPDVIPGFLAELWREILQRLVLYSADEKKTADILRANRAPSTDLPYLPIFFANKSPSPQGTAMFAPPLDVPSARDSLMRYLNALGICPNAISIDERRGCDRCNQASSSTKNGDPPGDDHPPPPPKKPQPPREYEEEEEREQQKQQDQQQRPQGGSASHPHQNRSIDEKNQAAFQRVESSQQKQPLPREESTLMFRDEKQQLWPLNGEQEGRLVQKKLYSPKGESTSQPPASSSVPPSSSQKSDKKTESPLIASASQTKQNGHLQKSPSDSQPGSSNSNPSSLPSVPPHPFQPRKKNGVNRSGEEPLPLLNGSAAKREPPIRDEQPPRPSILAPPLPPLPPLPSQPSKKNGVEWIDEERMEPQLAVKAKVSSQNASSDLNGDHPPRSNEKQQPRPSILAPPLPSLLPPPYQPSTSHGVDWMYEERQLQRQLQARLTMTSGLEMNRKEQKDLLRAQEQQRRQQHMQLQHFIISLLVFSSDPDGSTRSSSSDCQEHSSCCEWTQQPQRRLVNSSIMSITNLNPPKDAFEDEEGASEGLCHIRIQQRTGRKHVTTIQGIDAKYDLKTICRALKKECNCNATVVEDKEYGEVIQLTGDQRQQVKEFLCKVGIIKEENGKLHGY